MSLPSNSSARGAVTRTLAGGVKMMLKTMVRTALSEGGRQRLSTQGRRPHRPRLTYIYPWGVWQPLQRFHSRLEDVAGDAEGHVQRHEEEGAGEDEDVEGQREVADQNPPPDG